MQVLEAARRHGLPQVVVASSSSVYGANPELPKREDMVAMPVSPYAASKLAGESAALSYGPSFGLPVLAFRFFNVFGPLQAADHAYAAVVPTFVAAALRGEPLPVHGDGTQTRDFTYVGTVAAVLVDAVLRSVTDPRPVNLAFGTRVSLLELIGVLEGQLGRDLPRHHAAPRAGDVRDSQADQSRLRSLFPDIRPVPLEDGVAATLAWFTGRS
jgi:UDP-glucose 4-epimerase